MQSTAPIPPIEQRDTNDLLEDLCIALRNVGMRNATPETIQEVQAIDMELTKRGVPTTSRIERLSQETGWQMPRLLEECRDSPRVAPQIRLLNGLRRDHLCFACEAQERPDDPTPFLICDDCLRAMLLAIESRLPLPRMFLYRTFSPDARCSHANDETVLVIYPWWEAEAGACAECIKAELYKRTAG